MGFVFGGGVFGRGRRRFVIRHDQSPPSCACGCTPRPPDAGCAATSRAARSVTLASTTSCMSSPATKRASMPPPSGEEVAFRFLSYSQNDPLRQFHTEYHTSARDGIL